MPRESRATNPIFSQRDTEISFSRCCPGGARILRSGRQTLRARWKRALPGRQREISLCLRGSVAKTAGSKQQLQSKLEDARIQRGGDLPELVRRSIGVRRVE